MHRHFLVQYYVYLTRIFVNPPVCTLRFRQMMTLLGNCAQFVLHSFYFRAPCVPATVALGGNLLAISSAK